jgi:hypothetical protein
VPRRRGAVTGDPSLIATWRLGSPLSGEDPGQRRLPRMDGHRHGRPGRRPVAEGAASVVWGVTLPDDGPTGGFFRDGRPLRW